IVPTGTFRVTSTPSRPVLLEPSPWRPRSALYSGLKRKCTSVLWRSLDSMTMSPPLPPSPPDGPPRGTNFSRRKAMQPLPPSPAFTRIVASSMNMSAIYLDRIAELWFCGNFAQPWKRRPFRPASLLWDDLGFSPCGVGFHQRRVSSTERLLRCQRLNHHEFAH